MKLLSSFAFLIIGCAFSTPASADWPQFRGDAARSGYTEAPLPNRMELQWTFRTKHAPAPAWPTHTRIKFDEVFQPIIVDQTVLFGSSADDQLYALDLKTGELKWNFFTEGPIRFAPAAWKDRVFVASDDGCLYALAIKDGSLLWKKQGGPQRKFIMGNDRLISHWPARGGPAVVGDQVYFAAGVWPSDGVYLYALDAATGDVIWDNQNSGQMLMNQPHGGASAKSGVSSQGYLAASEDQIFMPTGRAVPAAFERATGKFQYYHLQKNQQRGGADVVLADQFFCNAGCLYDQTNGNLTQQTGTGPMVATSKGILRGSGQSLIYSEWSDTTARDRKGQPISVRQLKEKRLIPLDYEITDLIIAGNDAYCGSHNKVTGFDYKAQANSWWSHEIKGTVRGLAASDDCLVVSTDQGVISCFANAEPNHKKTGKRPFREMPFSVRQIYSTAAQEICDKTDVKSGICIDLNADDAYLAAALARISTFQIYVVMKDAEHAATARQFLHDAGLYGSRVVVHVADSEQLPYSKHFANLVICSASLYRDMTPQLLSEARRIQRPYGGQFCRGPVRKMQVETKADLQGAGSWTHQYSNSTNTVNSDDEIVKGPLKMYWYRDMDFQIPNRHGQGPAPLVNRGVMVVGGLHGLCGLDAYNGHTLWKYKLKNNLTDMNGIHHDLSTAEVGSNFCLGGDDVFVSKDDVCHQINLKTGKLVRKLSTPVSRDDPNQNWGYLGYHDGVVYGSVSNDAHYTSPRYKGLKLRNESVLFFAMDANTGTLLWTYQPEYSIRNNAITIGNNSVYLVDREIAKSDHIKEARRNGRPNPPSPEDALRKGKLKAFHAKTGKDLWHDDQEIFGTQLALSEDHEILLMFYQGIRHNFFQLPSEVGGRMAAIDAKTGKRIWDIKAEYQSHPVINGDKIYAQGGAWNLKTGKPIDFQFDRSYGCGQISASKHMMVFRSATLGYLDLTRKAGVENFGGIRLGCYINAIPAGGLVLVPDGSSQCNCSYQMQAWFALEGSE
ncbi:outer membrane biogenesis protein BamB [Gimesia maris]|uniref:outer membrane protein assembly factor BamB family protein n=1 Tax=Gimesia maris TaxID=122 RepID=UPI00118CABC3|nr:PQQ-binding-like beta-propeller repeat protein [Gimesia maris]QDU13738.1 outer membrane biogenesis protein BamB [Gimesia maris]